MRETKLTDIPNLRIGQKIGYINVCDELTVGEISHIYTGDKTGMIRLFVECSGQKVSFDIEVINTIIGDAA